MNQLIRSSSSFGANFLATQRAKSTTDFIKKLKVVEEEADERMYFSENLSEVLPIDKDHAKDLQAKCNEIISIVVSSINTSRNKLKK